MNSARAVAVAAVLLSVLVSARARAADPATLAVLPFHVDRLQVNTVQRLDEILRLQVAQRARMAVQDAETTHALVDGAQSLGLDCELATTACAAKFGGLADADVVLLGLAAGYGSEVGIDLRLVDVSTGTVISRASTLLPQDFDAQGERLTHAIDTLLAEPDHPARRGQGTIDATGVGPAGAELIVDGASRGRAPFTMAIVGLVPGPHVAQVRLDGYEEQTQRFTLAPADGYDLDVALLPGSGPRPKTAFEAALPWTVAAGGGVLLVAGLTAAGIGATPYLGWLGTSAEQESLDATSASFASDSALLWATMEQQQGDWTTWGLPATVTGSIVAGAGAVVLTGGLVWGLLGSDEVTE